MKEISLNASDWRQQSDFYNALLPGLGAPSWHGHNLDALNDSIGGDMNAVKPPFQIRITNTASIPPDLCGYLHRFAELVTDLRTRDNREVHLILD
ncbi:hypothetical protein GCM10011611_66870 [Aliidongia dinghuensis]|uniref:Barstar (barnase inhibitor) domain-containing protein n=1 Tax=Aliidongia dinghuensis TaxID=1867774 RepID=A0A8J2Z1L2_9PROT|nr:barstar family protein [Aliidongia dinghuensis]GGF51062.1 hypothetical protein GCM10011611_66870 [Aliidongia dinghuensis]